MISKKERINLYGNKVIDYVVTQGDSFVQTIKLDLPNIPIDLNVIKELKFYLGDDNFNQIYIKNYIYNDTCGNYEVELTSEETKVLNSDLYLYQVEITYTNNRVCTLLEGKMCITPEVKEREA